MVWAENEPEQTKLGGDLHAGFSLSRAGEALSLYAPNLTLIDSVRTTELPENKSAGRYPDGAASIREFELASPGSLNAIPPPAPHGS